MHKLLLAAFAVLMFAAGAYAVAYAQNLFALPKWTSSTRYGDASGTMGFNTVNNLPEWLDNALTWHSVAPTDSPTFTGTVTAAAINASGAITSNSLTSTTTIQSTTTYSVAGTPLPTCNTAARGTKAVVSDATSPTYLVAYTGSGAVVAPVFCNGTTWLTD